MHSSIKQSFS